MKVLKQPRASISLGVEGMSSGINSYNRLQCPWIPDFCPLGVSAVSRRVRAPLRPAQIRKARRRGVFENKKFLARMRILPLQDERTQLNPVVFKDFVYLDISNLIVQI